MSKKKSIASVAPESASAAKLRQQDLEMVRQLKLVVTLGSFKTKNLILRHYLKFTPRTMCIIFWMKHTPNPKAKTLYVQTVVTSVNTL